ncbi:ABC transporter permease [Roseibium sp.]|uniref:ABC transporter permease n=1 Tax=Roseibium sp. TaxID=1936156 RepID=UPI003A9701D6
MIKAAFKQGFMVLCAIYVVLPIMVVCLSALNGGRSMLFPPEDPTLGRFVDFFVNEPVWLNSLENSVVIALSAATLAILITWPVAYDQWKKDSKFSRILASLAGLPFALPPIVFGVGLSFLWTFIGGLGNMFTGILSHTALLAALPLVTISIGLQSIDRAHLDAAATMGASEGTILRTIILPQTLSYTLSGFFFVVVLSFHEFIVMFFVSASSYATVTLQIFNSLRNGFTPTMAVGAITFLIVSLIVFSLTARFGDLPRLMGADQARKDP